MRIDSHQHFWKYSPVEYAWIGDDASAIKRDFMPQELKTEMKRAGIDASISIQARQTLEETEFLLSLAAENACVAGVVGWAPLLSDKLPQILETLCRNPKLKGLRHVLQDEPDDKFILSKEFNLGISLLKEFDLSYDILIYERHLPQVIKFADMHPEQRFVLDHVAKPRIRDGVLEPWRKNMFELAKRANVHCKISGMLTEADPKSWTLETLLPYLKTALEAFGPERLLFGSDWPVCLLACEYERWVAVAENFISQLSQPEKDAIMGKNAMKFYKVNDGVANNERP